MSDDITNMLKDLLETETMLQGDSVLHHAHDLSSLSSSRSNPKTGMAPSEALPKSTELVRNLSNPTLHRRLSEPYVDQNNKLDDLVKRSLSNINSNTFATEKSVSFVDDMNSPLVDIVSFDEQDPPQQLLENSISTVSLSKTTPGSSILKSNSQTIIPDVLPLKPDDYNSDSGESDSMSSDGSESDTSSSTSDVRSPYELQNEDEDIEVTVDEEPEPSQQNSFFDNVEVDDTESVFEAVTVDDYADFDGLLDVLDDYIKLHPQSAIPSGEAFSPLPPNVQNHMLKLSISNERGPPVYPIQTMLSNPGINRLPSHQPRPERKKSRSNRSSLTIPTPNNPSHRKPSITLPDGSDDDDDDNTPLGVSSSASNSATNSAVRTTLPDGSDDDDVPLEIKVKAMNSAAIENKLTASSSDLAKQEKRKLIMEKLKEANITKITTRVYIEDATVFKTKVINSLMTSRRLVTDMSSNLKGDSFALFELCNDFGIERPLRDWEIVTDIMSSWDPQSVNAIIIKKYGYLSTLTKSAITGKYPRTQGYLYLELTPGTWSKRFCVLRDYKLVYYADGNNRESETLFCSLSRSDVYTTTRRHKKSITNFCFALRSDLPVNSFDNQSDYIKYICAEQMDSMLDWVLTLRMAKSERMWSVANANQTPNVENAPLSPQPLVSAANLLPVTPGSLLATSSSSREKEKKKKKVKPEREAEALKRSTHSGKKSSSKDKSSKDSTKRKKSKKPLIDISGTKHCRQCGCSELLATKNHQETCGNCFHDHSKLP